MYYHCIVPIAPMRGQASHKSEMVSQLLFGEAVQILGTAPGGWTKVAGHEDGYEGWVTQSHITAIGMVQPLACQYATEYVNTVLVNNTVMQVPFGAHIPTDELSFNTSKSIWDFSEAIIAPAEQPDSQRIIAIANIFLNTPYLWGGKTVHGIDCSGFVQQVYKRVGVQLPRDAWQQAEHGNALHFLQEALPGDVAFFDNEEGKITHTGILLNDHTIIHASGKVRIDRIDTEGIVNVDNGSRTHHLRIIKRLL